MSANEAPYRAQIAFPGGAAGVTPLPTRDWMRPMGDSLLAVVSNDGTHPGCVFAAAW